jgi:hypothetical protein
MLDALIGFRGRGKERWETPWNKYLVEEVGNALKF